MKIFDRVIEILTVKCPRPRGIHMVLTAAAVGDAARWQNGKSVYDGGGSLVKILDTTAAEKEPWITGRNTAFRNLAIQVISALVFGILVGSITAKLIEHTVNQPVGWMYYLLFGLLGIGIGWLIFGRLIDAYKRPAAPKRFGREKQSVRTRLGLDPKASTEDVLDKIDFALAWQTAGWQLENYLNQVGSRKRGDDGRDDESFVDYAEAMYKEARAS